MPLYATQMRAVRRSRRLSTHALPDSLDQCVPGGFDYLDVDYPRPPTGYSVATPVSYNQPLSPQAIESLSAFADQRELPPLDLHSQCRRRKGKNGNAPRPPNAFMLFRSDFWKFNKETIPERDHRQISRIAAHCWNALAEPRRVPYQDQAKKLKEEHALLYPQHKYNPSVKDRAQKKVKAEIDDDGLCDILAARVAQDLRASKSPKMSGSNDSGLLDQVMERKAISKRSRSASAALPITVKPFKGESQPLESSVKKRKRDLHNLSAGAVQVQSQSGLSHSPIPPLFPTDKISTSALTPSRNSPAVKAEPLQDLFLGVAAHTVVVVVENEPVLTLPPVAEALEVETAEPVVPEAPTLSPQLSSGDFQPPVQYLEKVTDSVVDQGLRFFEDYGIAGFFEGFDLSIFENLGDAPASMGIPEENDEFAQWCLNPC